jgi:transcriptional regulator with XRE-family HTH domain
MSHRHDTLYCMAVKSSKVRLDQAKAREARQRQGLSQIAVARELGTNQPAVSRLEGGALVSKHWVAAYAYVTKSDVAELLQNAA